MTDEELIKLVEDNVNNAELCKEARLYFCLASDDRYVIATIDTLGKEIKYYFFSREEISNFASSILRSISN